MDFAPVCCDWMSGRHIYSDPVAPYYSGKILKIDREGQLSFESDLWDNIRCVSSDTSIRVKCDGRSLRFTGNIGRFQHKDNEKGISVLSCVERWFEVLKPLGFDLVGFGSRWCRDTVGEWGTYLTRIDLAGNFDVSDFAPLSNSMMHCRIGQRLPRAGKYGPVWGYDSKRSNWVKAKLYDKTAELEGKRLPTGGSTRARFEVQLGSEYLKRESLDDVLSWKDEEMGQVIYDRFAKQVFRDTPCVEDWMHIPSRIRCYAILWRDGINLKSQMSKSAFYRVRTKLFDYGIDIAVPCNVVTLTRQCRVVEVSPVSALRDNRNLLRVVA